MIAKKEQREQRLEHAKRSLTVETMDWTVMKILGILIPDSHFRRTRL